MLTQDELRCYTDLTRYKTLEERFRYLVLNGKVCEETLGYLRYLVQKFYKDPEWIEVHDYVVIRDKGLDLGVPGWKIQGKIYVHHMNPVTTEQLIAKDRIILDPEYLISCSFNTHQAITYGLDYLLPHPPIVRRPGDTIPWR